MIGTDLNLKIYQAPDAVVGGRTVHVFRYTGEQSRTRCGVRVCSASLRTS